MISSINTDGPAAPFSVRLKPALLANLDAAAKKNFRSTGQEIAMRLDRSFSAEASRDHFASLAMQGLLAAGEADKILKETDSDWPEAIAGCAYAMADAMLAASEKGGAA